jgi:putative transposase
MTDGLKRYQQNGDFHFVTFSCYQRKPYLSIPANRTLFEEVLETMRLRYQFLVVGYVVMPEHVHLLLTEPTKEPLAKALMALKISTSKRLNYSPLWQARYYDFNVFSGDKQVEKLRYIHRNPVRRELVDRPEEWEWSSFRHYLTGARGAVEIESSWTAFMRERGTEKATTIKGDIEL